MGEIFFAGQPRFGANPSDILSRSLIWDDNETMDSDLISYWNETVSENDTVYVLGEFFEYPKVFDTVYFHLNGNILYLQNKKDALSGYDTNKMIRYNMIEIIYENKSIYLTNFLEHINSIETNFIVTSCDKKYIEQTNTENIHYETHKGTVAFVNNLNSPVYNVCIDYNNFRPFNIEDLTTSYRNYIRTNV